MLRAEEEGGKEGNRPSQIGQVKGEHKDNAGAVQWGIEGSLAAGEGADTEYGNGEGAEAACSGARSRGATLTQLGRSQNNGGTTRPYIRCSAGRCLRRCRRLHRTSACPMEQRHPTKLVFA